MKHSKHRTQFNTPTISWIVVTLPTKEALGLSGLSTQIGRIVDNYQENQNPKRFLGYIIKQRLNYNLLINIRISRCYELVGFFYATCFLENIASGFLACYR